MECSAVFTLHACVHALTDRILHCQCSVQMGFSFFHSPTYAHTRAPSHIVGTVVNGQLLTVFVLSFLVKSLYHFGASRYLTHMNDTNDAQPLKMYVIIRYCIRFKWKFQFLCWLKFLWFFSFLFFFLSTFIMPFFVRSLLRFCDVSFLFRSHHCFCFLCRFHFLTFSFVHFQREMKKKKQNEKENSIENRTIFVIALNVECMQA